MQGLDNCLRFWNVPFSIPGVYKIQKGLEKGGNDFRSETGQ